MDHNVLDSFSARTRIARDALQSGRDAIAAAQGYARETMKAGHEAVVSIRPRLADAKTQGTRYIAAEPAKTVLICAAGGALLAALLVSMLRRGQAPA